MSATKKASELEYNSFRLRQNASGIGGTLENLEKKLKAFDTGASYTDTILLLLLLRFRLVITRESQT